jgi:hypothetical protein
MKRKTTRDGVFIDGRDWSERDWSDLWAAMEATRTRIAKRHRERANPPTVSDSPADDPPANGG